MGNRKRARDVRLTKHDCV